MGTRLDGTREDTTALNNAVGQKSANIGNKGQILTQFVLKAYSYLILQNLGLNQNGKIPGTAWYWTGIGYIFKAGIRIQDKAGGKLK